MYKMFRYTKLSSARKKARDMKKKYGYTPTVFEEKHKKTKKVKYVVIKPKSLTKLSKV